MAQPVTATAVQGSTSDFDLTSFDGTRIRVHWFPAPGSSARPTVLYGPGFGSAGDVDTTSGKIPTLWAAGYNVLTWDPRGFGASGGAAEIDSPAYEARDVSTIIDWLAGRPGVELDRPGDPRLGMVGGSYGGGIQWITAASDCRVDAIVPQISWNSLVTSLDKSDTYKAGWANLLALIGTEGGRPDPHVAQAVAEGNGPSGQLSDASREWYAEHGPDYLLSRVRVPTLIEQGTVDTLFSLDEADRDYRALAARGVPVSMLWYCGGHGICLTDFGDPANDADPQNAEISWLDRWVKGDRATNTGPAFSLVDQNGVRYGAAHYPLATGEPVTGSGQGTLALVPGGGAGPLGVPPMGDANPLDALIAQFTPTKAANAVNVPIRATKSTMVVGAPRVRLAYRGTVAAGTRPTRVFAQLVDERTGDVVGNQITPIPVTLDGRGHTVDTTLEMVSQSMAAGDTLVLQLVATTPAYATPRLVGSVQFTYVTVDLPTARPGVLQP